MTNFSHNIILNLMTLTVGACAFVFGKKFVLAYVPVGVMRSQVHGGGCGDGCGC